MKQKVLRIIKLQCYGGNILKQTANSKLSKFEVFSLKKKKNLKFLIEDTIMCKYKMILSSFLE
jgi:hypothetical protein